MKRDWILFVAELLIAVIFWSLVYMTAKHNDFGIAFILAVPAVIATYLAQYDIRHRRRVPSELGFHGPLL